MRISICILLGWLLLGCGADERKATKASKPVAIQADTLPVIAKKTQPEPETRNTEMDLYVDSLEKVVIDTSTMKGKRLWILNQFYLTHRPSSPDFDTAFDLTYDGYKDYVIGYYAQAGTGLKNGVEVYLYNPKQKRYEHSDQLSVSNPTFYIRQKKITTFYIGNGGGSGERLEWRNNQWVVTKEFSVDNEGDSTRWKIYYPLKNKVETIARTYDMIPPRDILESQY